MRKLILPMSLLMGIVLLSASAHAAKGDRMISFSAGTGIPRGEFEGQAALGLIGSVGLDYMATKRLVIGLDGSFISNNGLDEYDALLTSQATGPVTSKFNMLQGGAHLKYMVSEAAISPFALVGLGAYKVKDSHESSDPMFDSPGAYDTFLGTRAELGLTYKTSDRVSIGVEGALHGVWTAFNWNNGFEAREFISVQTGVSIGMGNPAD